MSTNIDRAADVIAAMEQAFTADAIARVLNDYELLAPDLPEPNDPSIFVTDGAGWRTPQDSVVWAVIGWRVMIQRVEPGGFTPREARALADALYAAANHAEKEADHA